MKIAAASVLLLAALNCASAHWLDAAAARSNAMQSTWKAFVSPRFQNVSRLEVVAMMGVPMHEHERSLFSLPKSSSSFIAVPAAFSVDQQWPQCAAYIADQGALDLQRAHALRRDCDACCCRPVRVLLGVRHRRFLCRPAVHRKQRVQGVVHGASVYSVLAPHLRPPPIAYTCFLSRAFRFSRVAHPTKRSSRATKSPPTTAARAACPASCGTGLKPSASPQTTAIITPQALAVKRPPARIIS
jgi:hypothetical protein